MADGGARLEPGAIFATDYRVVRPLAEGGMGAVYVVDQLSTGKARALKLMRPELARDADSRRRFELEARVGARIQSDHVVEIHSAGVEDGTPFIVMELLDGEDLATRIERSGPLSAADTRDLFEQLCHAVAAAHSAGIVHRDLKPENVFLARTKRAGDARLNVKVLDFGIAKLVAESQTRGQTLGMIGTPAWMAPEQTELGKISPAADTWALGLILYFVLTGHSYWLAASDPEATLTQLLKEVVMGPLPAASHRARAQGQGGAIPPEVDAIIGRCLMRDPKQRLDDAQTFWSALSGALAPASARIVAAAPSGPAERTIAAAPLSPGLTQPLSGPHPALSQPSPPQSTPRMEPAPFVHDPAMRSGWGSWDKRWLTFPIGILISIGLQQCVSRMNTASRAAQLKAAQQQQQQRELGLRPGTVLPPVVKGTAARVDEKACKLCTTNVLAQGPVSHDAIASALDSAVPMLDQQCLTRKNRRGQPSSVTFTFAVREGRATKREIERSSVVDGTDECLKRSIGDIGFPSSPDETVVTATFSMNGAR